MKKRFSTGESLMENGIILGLVAIVGIGALMAFGGTINDIFFKSTVKVQQFQPFGETVEADTDDQAIVIDGNSSTDVDPHIPPHNTGNGYGNRPESN